MYPVIVSVRMIVEMTDLTVDYRYGLMDTCFSALDTWIMNHSRRQLNAEETLEANGVVTPYKPSALSYLTL